MIDKITLVKNNLTTSEILQVIDTNNLQYLSNEGSPIKTYHNTKTKNLNGGILIKIYGESIKIEGSIHKYFHYLKHRSLENYTVFTMHDFINTIDTLFKNFGLPKTDFKVINYEIGLNIILEKGDPIDYIKKVISIGNLDGNQRKMYINPRYKNERLKCTQMHKDNTIVFKIYDKNYERLDKGKRTKIDPCIRIETVRTRQKKLSFSDFIKPHNLTLLQNKFFAEWNLLNLDKEISAPKKTHQSKKDLAKRILIDGKKMALQDLEERRNQITPRIYRHTKEFINNWENHKYNFSLIPCEIAPLMAHYYNTAIQQVTKNTTTI